jgi:hypothetical protein
MIRFSFVLTGFISLFPGCYYVEDKNDQYLFDLWASVETIQVESIVNDKVTFNCVATVGDPCHEFERAAINIENLEVNIQLFSKRKKDRICAQIIGTIKMPITVKVLSGKTYNFHFWRLEEAPLDTTIFIP